MKKLFVLLFIVALAAPIFASTPNGIKVPQKAKDALTKSFPDAKNIKWEKEGNAFEANFESKNAKASIVVDANGIITETEAVIEKSQLPKGVENYIEKNHKNFKISEVSKIVNDKNITTYEVEVSNGKTKKDLFFDNDGKFLKK